MSNGRLELFYNCNRGLNIPRLYNYLEKSYNENPADTFLIVLFIRDCRNGRGERFLGRKALSWLLLKDPTRFDRIISYIPEIGRWDDFLSFWPNVIYCEKKSIEYIEKNFNMKFSENKLKKVKEVQTKILKVFAGQLICDLENMEKGEPISLCAKWAPTENCRLDRDKKVVKTLCDIVEWDKKHYRKVYISPLRKYGKVVERILCDGEIKNINMDFVPVKAMKKYKKKFIDTIPDKYYSRKIFFEYHKNYPQEIIYELRKNGYSNLIKKKWKNLKTEHPDIFTEYICVMDNSPSINEWVENNNANILPADIIYSFSLFFTQFLKSPFKNSIINLHHEPKLYKITGKTLEEKYNFLKDLPWGMTTSLEKIYTIIYKKISRKNLNKNYKIIIFSDKPINKAIPDYKKTFEIEAKYKNSDYNLPEVLYWNLNNDYSYPKSKKINNIKIINGYSTHILDFIISDSEYNPKNLLQSIMDNYLYSNLKNVLE